MQALAIFAAKIFTVIGDPNDVFVGVLSRFQHRDPVESVAIPVTVAVARLFSLSGAFNEFNMINDWRGEDLSVDLTEQLSQVFAVARGCCFDIDSCFIVDRRNPERATVLLFLSLKSYQCLGHTPVVAGHRFPDDHFRHG
ncbi:hypothetical protein SAMN05216252_108319 [Actinacidiphila glaucinigra]|uniref:Uncharacterized protein n=1 Tax=Actinacidiphila glaucinigra TaxID=235986 RepID=A0A239HDG6_9ACTN|nr:hypothetical protein SAMN05216252_108319 [Actinacidiphila glaucinigra]